MNIIKESLVHLLLWVMNPLLFWIVTRTTNENVKKSLSLTDEPIIFVLPKRSLFDLYLLYRNCKQQGLPAPHIRSSFYSKNTSSTIFLDKPGLVRTKQGKDSHRDLERLVAFVRKHPGKKLQIVCVSPFWGKNPGKTDISLLRLFFNDDENAGSLQKIMIVAAQGRNTVMQFQKPMDLNWITDQKETPVKAITSDLRLKLYDIFAKQRSLVLGQELYNREKVIKEVIASPLVRKVIEEDVKKNKSSVIRLENKARKYAREIAAKQTYSTIRFFEVVLGNLWNKLFDGIEIYYPENVSQVANEGYEIVYVPTHRSHLDYLLMSYVVHQSGFPVPHTAAGRNLDFFPVGGILRKGGAFYLRRSFRGKKLYTAVFNEYLHYLLSQGYPITFFPEGGRSRTGKLLPLKAGMFSMIVHSYLRDTKKPIAFVPIYIGYDKVFELGSYLKELSGAVKKKESFFQFLQSWKILKQYFGKAYVSYGKPLKLDRFLDASHPDWRDFAGNHDKPEWMNDVVTDMVRILRKRINESVVVSPVSLVGFALLSSPHNALPREDLERYIDMLLKLADKFNYDGLSEISSTDTEEVLKRATLLNSFSEFKHSAGGVVHLSDIESVLISYYSNNISHIFALPSLVARFFRYNELVQMDEIYKGCLEIYPILQEEYALKWMKDRLEDIVEKCLTSMCELGLLVKESDLRYRKPALASEAADNLDLLGNALGSSIDRYVITTSILAKHAPHGMVNSKIFEQQCQRMIQRVAILNGINNPDFVEKKFISKYIALLKNRGLIRDSDKTEELRIDSKVSELGSYAQKLLSHDARNSIEKIFS